MFRLRTLLVIAALAGVAALSFSDALFAQSTQPSARPLQEGAGRATVEALCSGCHTLGVISASSGYTRAQWEELIGTMVSPPDEQKSEILDYLARAYPPNNPRPAQLAAGPLHVTFHEWVAPQLGQRARDPVEAPDGSIWWVGQRSNTIGRLDPRTGEMREWLLPPRALPHSVNVDADGGVWYMGNGNGTIGRFDYATGRSTEYRMPDPRARDPHTAEFDRDGIMWFTLQQSNMIGRFDPRSGEIRLAEISTDRARPYGIKIAADGAPWVACNGRPCLIRVAPETMELRVVGLPGEQTTVRRLDIAEDGVIWYVNSGRGRLGRYDPATGDIREWPSPSGPNSHPYAIAVIGGVVWYNESGVRPDMLVRFDPRSESFQSWPIPSGGLHAGMVRHMRPTRDGDLLLHQGSTNRIILAELPDP
jgi:virginiamycin B lyase